MKTHVIVSSAVGLVEHAFATAFPEEYSRGVVSYSVSSDRLSAFPTVVAPYGYELASPRRFPTDVHLSLALSEREARRIFKADGARAPSGGDSIYIGFNLLTRFRIEGRERYPKTGDEMAGFLTGRVGDSCDYVFSLSIGDPYHAGSYPMSMYAFGKDIRISGPEIGYGADEGPIGEFFRHAEPEVGAEISLHLEEFFIRTRQRYYRPFGFN